MERQVTPVGKRNELGLACKFVSMWEATTISYTWFIHVEEITFDGPVKLELLTEGSQQNAILMYNQLIAKYNLHSHTCWIKRCEEVEFDCQYTNTGCTTLGMCFIHSKGPFIEVI